MIQIDKSTKTRNMGGIVSRTGRKRRTSVDRRNDVVLREASSVRAPCLSSCSAQRRTLSVFDSFLAQSVIVSNPANFASADSIIASLCLSSVQALSRYTGGRGGSRPLRSLLTPLVENSDQQKVLPHIQESIQSAILFTNASPKTMAPSFLGAKAGPLVHHAYAIQTK